MAVRAGVDIVPAPFYDWDIWLPELAMQTSPDVSPAPARPRKIPFDLDAMTGNARQASAFLKALSHETRLLILCLLIDGPKTVSELEAKLALRQPLVSQQLARLRAEDLVEAQRYGKNVRYAVSRPEVVAIIGALYKAFCQR